jgi:hypothetical protein
MFYDERIEALASKINEIADARVEYETTHKDALDAYSHLPREGDWTYHDNDARVAQRARDLGLSVPKDLEDALGDACLDRITWRFDSQYHGSEPGDLGQFTIGEIETQIDHEHLPSWFNDKSPEEKRAIIEDVNRVCDHYVQGTTGFTQWASLLVYSTVDAAVFYSLSDKALREAHAAVMGDA